MSFLSTLDITGSALTAERFRMDIIAQNIANIDTTNAPDGEPYRRKLTVFQERPLNTFQTSLERAAKRVSAQTAAARADSVADSSTARRDSTNLMAWGLLWAPAESACAWPHRIATFSSWSATAPI